MSATAPWASHYEVPRAAHEGRSDGHSASRRGSSRERVAGSDGRVQRGAYLGDQDEPQPARGSVGSGQDSEADWKRPRTLAPPWAAGGGQEMILSSPAQGRKVSFVIEKPAYFNVEDAPSAVPTSRSDRSWEAGENRPRPTTPAAPPVLRQPGALASRPRTPAAHALPGRQSMDLGEDSDRAEVASNRSHSSKPDLRPHTPAAPLAGGSQQYAHAAPDHADELDTAPLRFVKAAEAALQGQPAAVREIGDGVDSMAMRAVDAGSQGASVAEPGIWNTSPPPSGKGRDAYGVVATKGKTPSRGRGAAVGRGGSRGAESARDRAKGTL